MHLDRSFSSISCYSCATLNNGKLVWYLVTLDKFKFHESIIILGLVFHNYIYIKYKPWFTDSAIWELVMVKKTNMVHGKNTQSLELTRTVFHSHRWKINGYWQFDTDLTGFVYHNIEKSKTMIIRIENQEHRIEKIQDN